MIPRAFSFTMTAMLLLAPSWAFFVAPSCRHRSTHQYVPTTPNKSPTTKSSSTALNLLLDVPDSFFTVTMFTSGILLSLSKSFGRLRMEERAWEQRLEEGRKRRLARDPTLTELDLRRREAAMEWSAYGKPRMDEEAEERRRQEAERLEEEDYEYGRGNRRRRVQTMEQEEDDEDDYRQYRMTEQEIDQFEVEFGVDYDPYYDDPYTEDELPEGQFSVDKRYGDRIYEDGEIFYKDTSSGLYYRQGAKPRASLSFFS